MRKILSKVFGLRISDLSSAENLRMKMDVRESFRPDVYADVLATRIEERLMREKFGVPELAIHLAPAIVVPPYSILEDGRKFRRVVVKGEVVTKNDVVSAVEASLIIPNQPASAYASHLFSRVSKDGRTVSVSETKSMVQPLLYAKA